MSLTGNEHRATGESVALCFIMKDEASVLPRLISSVNNIVDSVICIDTGSTDSSKARLIALCKSYDLDLVLEDRPWKDFGWNRSQLMKLAHGKADWLLLLDADMTVYPNEELTLPQGYESFLLWYAGPVSYAQKLLVSGNLDWSYVGRTHEYIKCEKTEREGQLPDLKVIHWGDGSNRTIKAQRDLELLRLDAEEGDIRALFYLGQTSEDIGDFQAAIQWYTQRAVSGGWEEERWLAQMRSAKLSNSIEGLLAAWEARSWRAEPLYYLAVLGRNNKMFNLALMAAQRATHIEYPENDLLFVEQWVYEWGLLLEQSIALWWIGEKNASAHLGRWMLDNIDLPPHAAEAVERNLGFTNGRSAS